MEKKKRINKEERKEMPGGCSLMTLTSKSKRKYWFRTCDISFDLRKEGAHRVKVERGQLLKWEEGEESQSKLSFQGISYREENTWLLDGINEAGLCGGLLMLKEAEGSKRGKKGENRVMAMEAVAWFLSRCTCVEEVIFLAQTLEITNIYYKENEVAATVHYHFCDPKGEEVILEPVIREMPGKLKIYRKEDTLGVMTNSPVYEKQKQNLSWFLYHSPELNQAKSTEITSIILDEKRIEAKKETFHLSKTGTFPASFASYDRFIRLAVLKALNNSGNYWGDQEIISKGISIMNLVREPENAGVFHYSHVEEEEGRLVVVGGEESKTEYLVIYDLTEKKCYLQWFDEMNWTCYTL